MSRNKSGKVSLVSRLIRVSTDANFIVLPTKMLRIQDQQIQVRNLALGGLSGYDAQKAQSDRVNLSNIAAKRPILGDSR